jgi:hypothetical protein
MVQLHLLAIPPIDQYAAGRTAIKMISDRFV